MTPLQKQIHEEALKRSRHFKRAEWPRIEILQRVAVENVHRGFGRPHLFAYSNKELGLSEPLSGAFTNVAMKAMKAMKIPQLGVALRETRFSVTKIIRIREKSGARLKNRSTRPLCTTMVRDASTRRSTGGVRELRAR